MERPEHHQLHSWGPSVDPSLHSCLQGVLLALSVVPVVPVFCYCSTQLKLYTLYKLSSSIFCCLWVKSVSGIGNTRPNLHFFQYIQAQKPFTDSISTHRVTHIILGLVLKLLRKLIVCDMEVKNLWWGNNLNGRVVNEYAVWIWLW